MCGRYTQTRGAPEVQRHLQATGTLPEYGPRYNLAPTQNALVAVQAEARTIRLMRWGLIPAWAADADIGTRLINARAETLTAKPAFKQAFQRRRCLIPSDGFYEWIKEGTRKRPVRFSLQTGELFAFAGLWDRWRGPDDWLETFVIITTSANEIVKPVHDRMPAILARDQYDSWLAETNPVLLQAMLQPFTAGVMQATLASTRINSPTHDSPECLRPEVPEAPGLGEFNFGEP